MSVKLDVKSVRREVYRHIGTKVKVRTNVGRNRVDVTEGVISNTYPSIFTVQVEAKNDIPERTLSYSYNDVITHDIELVVCHS